MWYVEAGKYNVLPIDSRGTLRFADERPQIAADRKQLHLLPGHADRCRATRRRDVLNRPHSITADVEIPKGGAEGVLLSHGRQRRAASRFYVQDGKLHYGYNYVGAQQLPRRVERDVAGGPARAALRVRADRQARHRQRQGRAGRGAALHRRQAGRAGRHARHHAALDRPRRRHRLRRRHRARRCRTSTSRRSRSPARSTA